MSPDTDSAGILSRKALHSWSLNSGFARPLALGRIELDVKVSATAVRAGFKLAAVWWTFLCLNLCTVLSSWKPNPICHGKITRHDCRPRLSGVVPASLEGLRGRQIRRNWDREDIGKHRWLSCEDRRSIAEKGLLGCCPGGGQAVTL
jgi:hypothetical protein